MCRNIKLLHHFEPPATKEEIRDSALQYVRKLTGMQAPSRANRVAFERAVDTITATMTRLLDSLEAHGPPRTREAEKLKAAERGRKREEQMQARFLRKVMPPAST
ncbi:DUF2277 domain-containing protein [Hyalangium versicolor]|uniref:DUF2277 domain-containing protein n=1 Tax=Hyalangium versicolor TaxID=2861190 RepID=UPI001CCEC874|nr:DUF2277 domain-containing protein [Hyalangium versicolor]